MLLANVGFMEVEMSVNLKEKISRALSFGMLKLGRDQGEGQYSLFCEHLTKATQTMSQDGVTVEWGDGTGDDVFKLLTPVGKIFAKRISFLDDDTVGVAILFYTRASPAGEERDLTCLRLSCNGAWKLPGDVQVTDRFGRQTPESAIRVIQAAMHAKLLSDHSRATSAGL